MKAIKFDAQTRALLLFVNLVLVLAVAGVVLMFSKTGQIKRTTQTTQQVDNSKITREVVVSNDKTKLNAESIKFMNELAHKHQLAAAVGGGKLSDGSLKLPTYQFDGESFGLKLANSDGYYYVYKADFGKRREVGGAVWQAIVDEAKSKGYKMSDESDDLQFDNEQAVCRLTRVVATDASPTQKSKDALLVTSLSLSCLDKAYLMGLVNFYRPIVTVMTQDRQAMKHFRLNANLEVREVAVAPGATAGYQTAELKFENDALAHLFYQKNGEAWQYFQSVNKRILPCQDFNTETLKRAYWGSDCLDAKNQPSIVIDAKK